MEWHSIGCAPMDSIFIVCDKEHNNFAIVYKSYSFGLIPEGVECDSHYDIRLSFEPYEWRWIE